MWVPEETSLYSSRPRDIKCGALPKSRFYLLDISDAFAPLDCTK